MSPYWWEDEKLTETAKADISKKFSFRVVSSETLMIKNPILRKRVRE
jgi:hypothetical protein